jgi:ubiquinone/menaquinone biosynthesis C-methylase UbiE
MAGNIQDASMHFGDVFLDLTNDDTLPLAHLIPSTSQRDSLFPEATERPHLGKKADHYDDPDFQYMDYWTGRSFEHRAEEIAIRRLLRDQHFAVAVDVGGGYGRLSVLLEQFADSVTLVDPSRQQLETARAFLSTHPRIDLRLMQADELKFQDSSVDLVTMIRVLHHIPDPRAELAEVARVLAPEGRAIIEVANSLHIRNRLRRAINRKKASPEPQAIPSKLRATNRCIPFVNHNPHTIMDQFSKSGLRVVRTLSVSNLRSPWLKKLVSAQAMLAVESVLQPVLAGSLFGPSLFFLLQKT